MSSSIFTGKFTDPSPESMVNFLKVGFAAYEGPGAALKNTTLACFAIVHAQDLQRLLDNRGAMLAPLMQNP
jgi:hypothetical protein